jgi:pimeloyl-ACP methyl ester carboxylesterase
LLCRNENSDVNTQPILASKRASGDRLDQVHTPRLVIMGTRDPDFKQTAEEAQWVGTALHGQVHMIEGAGHL